MGMGDDEKKDTDALDQKKVTIISACCCCYEGYLCGDGCYGWMGSSTHCCIESEVCCKQGADKLCCICCALRLVSPSVCIKEQTQCCCLVAAVAIPPDDEVPCMLAQCCITCYPTFGALKKIEDLFPDEKDGGGGPDPDQIGG